MHSLWSCFGVWLVTSHLDLSLMSSHMLLILIILWCRLSCSWSWSFLALIFQTPISNDLTWMLNFHFDLHFESIYNAWLILILNYHHSKSIVRNNINLVCYNQNIMDEVNHRSTDLSHINTRMSSTAKRASFM